MKKIASIAAALLLSVVMVACNNTQGTAKPSPTTAEATAAGSTATEKTAVSTGAEQVEAGNTENKAPAPHEEGAAGFDEIPIGEKDVFPLHISGVYFQPVDMEPAGNSLARKDADMHLEADISAMANNELGYDEGSFVPYLQVKAFIQKKGSDKVEEVAFMPMNASDGPHYGANVKMHEGLGKYVVRFEVSAPSNDYLLHVDKTTGVNGRFWTEPLVAEWELEWKGPQW